MKLGFEIEYQKAYLTPVNGWCGPCWSFYLALPWYVRGQWGWKCRVWRFYGTV
jgi:hypothetical protein